MGLELDFRGDFVPLKRHAGNAATGWKGAS